MLRLPSLSSGCSLSSTVIVALDSGAQQYASKVTRLVWRTEEEERKRKDIPTDAHWLTRVVPSPLPLPGCQ
jgi:hypothetical protein